MRITRKPAFIAMVLMMIPLATACALPGPQDATGEEGVVKLNILVRNKTFTAMLEDNASARALAAMMPLTLDMTELNGNEKYFYLPSALPANSAKVGLIKTGDLMLYQSNYLVLFYKTFSPSYSYTRLGSVIDAAGLAAALGNGGVRVSISVSR